MAKPNRKLCLPVLAGALMFAGCSTGPPSNRSEVPVEDRGRPVTSGADTLATVAAGAGAESVPESLPDPLPRTNTDDPVLLALVTSANTALASGDADNAVSYLERGIRVQPRNARLWHRLARVRLQQKQYHLALGLAEKSMFLAQQDGPLRRLNLLLITEIKRALGDKSGADEALREASRIGDD